MGKSRPSASRKLKQSNFVRHRKEGKLSLALEQLAEYQHAFMSTHELSSKQKIEIENVQKELQVAEEKKKELVEYYKRLIEVTVEEREDSLLTLVKERLDEEWVKFEKEKMDLMDSNRIIRIQLNRLKEDQGVNETRIQELEGEVEDLEEEIEKLEKEKERLRSRLARGSSKK